MNGETRGGLFRRPDSQVAANEKMFIYAFTNEADWGQFKPPPGELSEADAQTFAEELEARLKAIPASAGS